MLSLRAKFLLGYGVLVLMLALVSVIALLTARQYDAAHQQAFDDRFDILLECTDIHSLLLSADLKLTKPPQDRTPSLPVDSVKTRIDRFLVLLAEQKKAHDQLPQFTSTRDLLLRWLDAYQRVAAAPAPKRAALYASDLHPLTETASSHLVRLSRSERTDLQQDSVEGRHYTNVTRIATILLAASGIGLAGLLLVGMGRWFVRPLQKLTISAEQIKNGNLDVTFDAQRKDEIGRLGAAFDAMAARLREFRRTDQARLLRTQESTRAAINSLPHAVALFNPDDVVEIANNHAQRLFGLIPGQNASAFPHKWLLPLLTQARSSRKPIDPVGYESVIQIFENNQELFFLPHAQPTLDDRGNLVGITIVLVDATQLREIDEAKSGLLSMVSHELKTPLTSVQMSIHLLMEDAAPQLKPRQLELLEAARDDTHRLQRLIDDLLDMGRIRSGATAIHAQTVSPQTLVETALSAVDREFAAKNISLTSTVDGSFPPVHVDSGRINQLFLNLLTNACKYTPAGGTVTISAATADDFVQFFVADTGIGIPPSERETIFERYVRGQGSIDLAPGAGLGLAIAREIVEAHGGTIGVSPNYPNGSLFQFTLPRAK